MPPFEAMKAQTQLLANSHPSFTVNLFQSSHDVSVCSTLQTKHCSLAPAFAWVSFRTSYFFLNHFDLFKFDWGFSFSGFSLVLAQPRGISWTWTSVRSHLSRSLRSTSFGCNSNFRLLHLKAILRGIFGIIC